MEQRPLFSVHRVQLGESTTLTHSSLKVGCNRWSLRFSVSYELIQGTKYIKLFFSVATYPLILLVNNNFYFVKACLVINFLGGKLNISKIKKLQSYLLYLD